MDETSYNLARTRINQQPCVFERALLARAAVCEAAQRISLAEREVVACRQPLVRVSCGQLLTLLRTNSAFALKVKDAQRILPHAMAMKVQCGGLVGLRDLLDPDAAAPDIMKLVRLAQAEYASFAALPFSRIVQGVVHWQGRKRRPPGAPQPS
ncbi:MAG: hypothetical protein Q8N33_06990 [Rhodocyclaceae bacterium]|nr:hypothetical protein [Rhodocyclaceae bacterium]